MADLFPSRWLLPPSFSLYPDDAAILRGTSLDSAPVPKIIITSHYLQWSFSCTQYQLYNHFFVIKLSAGTYTTAKIMPGYYFQMCFFC